MNTLRTLFRESISSEEREDLQERIFSTLAVLKATQMRRRRQMVGAGLLLSGTSVVSAVLISGGTFVGSEFWSVLSLFFSDLLVVVNYWNEFSLLLLETLPVVPLLTLLVPIFVFSLFLGMYFQTKATHRFSY